MSVNQILQGVEHQLPDLVKFFAWARTKVPSWQKMIVAVSILLAMYIASLLVQASDTRGNDDAAIAWRYSLNLANGHGLVYNPGEYVEGFSSFGYVVALAVGYSLFREIGPLFGHQVVIGDMYWISLFYNLIAWAALIILVYRFAREEVGDRLAPFVALMVGLSPAIAFWAISGMETVPAMLSQVLIWVWVVRLEKRVGTEKEKGALTALFLSMAFCLLMRAEGFLWPFLALGYLFVFKRLYKQTLAVGLMFAVFMAAFISWRLWYYGYPLPNTYYAKVTGTFIERLNSAWSSFDQSITPTGLFLSLIILSVAFLEQLRIVILKGLKPVNFGVIMGITLIMYWFYVGGDIYFERFLLLLIPVSSLVAAKMLRRRSGTNLGLLALAVSLVVTVMPLYKWYIPSERAYSGDGYARVGQLLGKKYPGAVMAIDAAGKVPYFSGLTTIDMFGLNDEHIAHYGKRGEEFKLAHDKMDTDYVFGRRPNLVVSWLCLRGGNSLKTVNDTLTVKEMSDRGYKPVMLFNAVQTKITGLEPGVGESEIINLILTENYQIGVFYNPDPNKGEVKVASK